MSVATSPTSQGSSVTSIIVISIVTTPRTFARRPCTSTLARMKMCECTLRRVRDDCVAQHPDLVPLRAGTAHSCVDRQVPGPICLTPLGDRTCVAERRREVGPLHRVEVSDEQRCENDDGT